MTLPQVDEYAAQQILAVFAKYKVSVGSVLSRAGRRAAADALRTMVASRRRRSAPAHRVHAPDPRRAPAHRRRTPSSPTTSSTSSPTHYVDAAVLAHQAGFDFVDVKHCHGYLLHELLSARRPSGPVRRRSRRAHALPAPRRRRDPRARPGPRDRGAAVGVRPRPVTAGRRRHGRAGRRRRLPATRSAATARARHRPHRGRTRCSTCSASSASAWSARRPGARTTTPHVQRPAYFPPSDGYLPPEDPLVGVARQIAATRELDARASGHSSSSAPAYSYLQEWLPNVAQARGRRRAERRWSGSDG